MLNIKKKKGICYTYIYTQGLESFRRLYLVVNVISRKKNTNIIEKSIVSEL
jgi:hypothetical protein